MKILITGITGQLGTALAESLQDNHEITGLCKDSSSSTHPTVKADLSDWKTVYDAITRINPDVVIHTAAQSNVDACEKDPEYAYRINALGTRNIAIACQRFDAVMVHISTDYVFSGDNAPQGGYTEFDATAPASVYGKSKLQGEEFVRSLLSRYFIVRTSWLFGRTRANFVSQIVSALNEGSPYTAVDDMYSAPTLVTDLADGIAHLITTPLYGTYHLTNTGFSSRYEIAQAIAVQLGVPHTVIRKASLKDLRLPAPRPLFSGLRNYVWELNNFKPLRSWQDAVSEFIEGK
ncbi:MAG: dTDP-4-dehydrorhamnose reductase [Elusimicrobia bacterium]|nr:dTDP-4-dehydrorhamnose reductase [Elusimicrobiota bacterium]